MIQYESIKIKPMPGSSIKTTIEEAIEVAKQHNCKVMFYLNDVSMVIYKNDDPNKIEIVYNYLLREGY